MSSATNDDPTRGTAEEEEEQEEEEDSSSSEEDSSCTSSSEDEDIDRSSDDEDDNSAPSPQPPQPPEEAEEEMPILKYHRMKAHVQAIKQATPGSENQITALCMHPRCLIVGTLAGNLHLLDYQGSGQELGRIRADAHKGQRIRCISIDDSGEFVVSCSDAGTVVVVSLTFLTSSSLGTTFPAAGSASRGGGGGGGEGGVASSNFSASSSSSSSSFSSNPSPPTASTADARGGNSGSTFTSSGTAITGRSSSSGNVVVGSEQIFCVSQEPLYAVHLDPGYRRKTEKGFVCGGQEGKLILTRKGFFSGSKEECLHEGEGAITAIAWRGGLVAWANEEGVKILDIENDERISFVERPEVEGGSGGGEELRCSLVWESETVLLIGWFDTFIVLQVKPRVEGGREGGLEGGAGRMLRMGEIVVRWKADCVICGVFPFDVDSVAILGYVGLVEGEDDDEDEAENEDEDSMPFGRRIGDGAGASLPRASPPPPVLPKSEKKVICRAELQLRTRKEGRIFSAEILPFDGEERVRDSTGFCLASSFALTCRKVPGPGVWRLPRGMGRGREGGTLGGKGSSVEAGQAQQERHLAPPPSSRSSSSSIVDTGESFMPVMLMAAPEDLIVARVRNVEDWILFVLQHGALGAAIELALLNRHLLTQQRFHALATSYLEQLLARGAFERAAAECPRLLGEEAALWERWIYSFASRGKLSVLAPFIPLQTPRLNQTTYEMVLMHFLDNDKRSFLEIIKKWGGQQLKFGDGAGREGGRGGGKEKLYDLQEVSKRVGAMVGSAPDETLLQAQAYLFELQGKHAAALGVYWELFQVVQAGGKEGRREEERKRLFAPVFGMIEGHDLFEAAAARVLTLVQMDRGQAGGLLVRHVDRFPVESVVRQLQQQQQQEDQQQEDGQIRRQHDSSAPAATASAASTVSTVRGRAASSSSSSSSSSLLLWYLDLLFRRLPDQYNHPDYSRYHLLQVELYAAAAPTFRPVAGSSHIDTIASTTSANVDEDAVDENDSSLDPPYTSALLSFLTWSNHVRLETALAACERRTPPLYDEMVYILGRIGDTEEALRILLFEIGSVRRAIDFVDRQDKGLWKDLTEHSLNHPVFLAGLLRHAGEYNVDLARSLLQQIPGEMRIKGLKNKLLNIVASYRFERTLHEGVRRVAEQEWVAATRRFHHAHRRAIRVNIPDTLCQGCSNPLVGPAPQSLPPSLPPRALASVDARELHVFACKDSYHDVCCLALERRGGEGGREGGREGKGNERGHLTFQCVKCREEAQYELRGGERRGGIGGRGGGGGEGGGGGGRVPGRGHDE
ncbi:vacuolar protein sorting 41 [Nannochloropsis oceanica]